MAATVRAQTRNARAKLNLRLVVGRSLPTGLHEVRSAIADLLVCDEVAFLPSERGFAVSCDRPDIPERANLAWRAAQALGVELPPIRIHVRKHVPVEAGLGGGSADAAAALLGIVSILSATGVTFSREALFAAAARVGSDVPACLVPGMKIVGGAGDVVRPIAARAPHWGVLLLKPAVGVPTAHAYALLDEARARVRAAPPDDSAALEELAASYVAADLGRTCALLRNDLQAPVEAAYPDVAHARSRIIAAGAAASVLCGSGSCVAGLFENVAAAEKALVAVRPRAGEWAIATGFADGD